MEEHMDEYMYFILFGEYIYMSWLKCRLSDIHETYLVEMAEDNLQGFFHRYFPKYLQEIDLQSSCFWAVAASWLNDAFWGREWGSLGKTKRDLGIYVFLSQESECCMWTIFVYSFQGWFDFLLKIFESL